MIDPVVGVGATVQLAAVVRSYVVLPEIPCAMKAWFTVCVASALQVFVQELTGTVVPWHTSKLVILPRYAVAVAVALMPCAAAVIVEVPLASPSTVALPHS